VAVPSKLNAELQQHSHHLKAYSLPFYDQFNIMYLL